MNILEITIIPMTHAPETGAIILLHFSGAGTCVIQIWDQIPLLPDSGAD